MIALIALPVGVVLVVAGVAVVFWPAALVVAGAALILLALFVDPDAVGRSRP